MNNTPGWLRNYWSENPAKGCDRIDDLQNCKGRLTKEHAIYYAGRQVQEIWAVLDLCVYHHLREGLKKNINQAIAYSRATDDDLKKYPKLSIPHARAIQKLFLPN